jgi:hypothetical protein
VRYLFWTAVAVMIVGCLQAQQSNYVPDFTLAFGTPITFATHTVIYDRSFDVYLAVYPFGNSPRLRASKDLIHWSAPFHATYTETGNSLIYPTLVGETGDPTIGGLAPRVYFSSFPVGKFPDYTTATFESVPLILTPIPRHRAAKH